MLTTLFELSRMLIAGSIVGYFTLRLFFKNSVFQRIGFLWIVNVIINASISKFLYTYPDDFSYWIALPLGLGNTAFFFYLTYKMVKTPLNKAIENINQLANGNLNLEKQDKTKYTGELKLLDESTHKLSSILVNAFAKIKASSLAINNMSSDMNIMAENLSTGNSEQASSIEEISSSMEEMSANISASFDNAQLTKQKSEESNTALNKSSISARKLEEAILDITGHIKVIDTIATETNLLALNASIEAKQAGEAGKGFNVVAAEVKNLAENSSKSALQIQELSERCKLLSEELIKNLEDTIPTMKITQELMTEITSASMELKTGSDQITSAVNEINTTTQSNAGLSEELSGNSSYLFNESKTLNDSLEGFKS
ncbi:methyl-accepting chemotaxis protein [Saccharicrinis aurantiacus]|uniref:methyl-accepting chemotaxis protein n=1 Tax=Saccharicrinis aurantiacus TaxID=1849719 RepID=UPI00094FAE36|nr:methyl-accepting chemotaxis protein [Saccharicrinis aurantiacus]